MGDDDDEDDETVFKEELIKVQAQEFLQFWVAAACNWVPVDRSIHLTRRGV
jgi:hypothetical protein